MKAKPKMAAGRARWLKGQRTHLRKLRLRAIVENDQPALNMYDEALGVLERTLEKHKVKF